MIKNISFLLLAISLSLTLQAKQQETPKHKKGKQKPANNIKKCEPESKPDTTIIDLKTGRPKTTETDTTNKLK